MIPIEDLRIGNIVNTKMICLSLFLFTLYCIFENSKAIPEYSATTRSQAADASRCRTRYELLVSLLEQVGSSFDIVGFKEWKEQTSVLKADQGVVVDIQDFSEFELRSIYTLWMDRKTKEYKQAITDRYKKLEAAYE